MIASQRRRALSAAAVGAIHGVIEAWRSSYPRWMTGTMLRMDGGEVKSV